MAGLCIILAAGIRTGLVPMRSYVEDLIFFADNAWRVLAGQRPFLDYSSGLGPVTYLISALGLKLSGGRIDGLGYGNFVAGFAIGVWAYGLLVRRVSGVLAVCGSFMLCLLALAPVQLGESFRLSTIAMSYNRQGYALLGLLIVEGFPLREGNGRQTFPGALSSGLICAILFYLKANYFLVSAVLAVASLLWSGAPSRRRIAGLFTGFAAGFLAFAAYLRFDFGPMLSDLRMAADARSGAVSNAFLAQVFAENSPALLIMCGLTAVALLARATEARLQGWPHFVARYRAWVLLGMVYLAGGLLLVTNAQMERLPLQELMVLLMLDLLLQQSRLDPRLTLAVCAVGVGLIAGPASADPLALANGLRLKLHTPTQWTYRVIEGGFAGAIFIDDQLDDPTSHRAFGRFLALYLNDGYTLLRSQIRPGEEVTTMDTYNGFPYALGIEPPRGGMASATYKYLFSDRYHPSPSQFFGTADLVMFPKEHALLDYRWDGLMKYYAAELQRRYALAAESAQWKLYRKKAPPETRQ